MLKRNWKSLNLVSVIVLSLAGAVEAEVVRFRLEVTEMNENSVDSVVVGQEFLFRSYVQDLRNLEMGGVFAGYMDVAFNELATVSGTVEYGLLYQNGKSGELSTSGMMDNIGSFSSSGEQGNGIDPIGPGEHLLFSLPMRALAPGTLTFTGATAANSPTHDVLVYGEDGPVSPDDIDFGDTDVKIDFGQLTVSVVPEPTAAVLAYLGSLAVLGFGCRSRI